MSSDPKKSWTTSQWARYYLDCGLSIIPLRHGRAPACRTTKPYQSDRASPEQIVRWFDTEARPGIGILGGLSSGNLEIIDFDDPTAYEEFRDLVSLPMVVVKSPRSFHVYYRCPKATPKNLKILSEDGDEVLSVRAQGLYVVAPGSQKAIYEKIEGGATYDLIEGDFDAIPEWTPKERENARQTLLTFGNDADGGVGQTRTVFDENGMIPPGGRHTHLTRAAWFMARRIKYPSAGDFQAILSHLKELNKLCVDKQGKPDPRPDNELFAMVQSAIEKDTEIRIDESQRDHAGGQLVDAVFTPLNELPPEPEPEFFWDGAIARGWITVLVGQPKIGKTTLLTNLMRSMQTAEPFLGQATQTCNLVLTTEEHVTHWQRRVEMDGLDPSTRIQAVPFLSKPRWKQWEHYVETIARQVDEIDLCILDPWINFTPASENDADEVAKALMCLRALTEVNMACLVIHHGGKSQPGVSRGSSALDGFVDMMLSLTHQVPRQKDNRRRLTFAGRYPDSPGILDFSVNAFGEIVSSENNKSKSQRRTRKEMVLETLKGKTASEGMPVQDLADTVGMHRPHCQTALSELLEENRIGRSKVDRKFFYYDLFAEFWSE